LFATPELSDPDPLDILQDISLAAYSEMSVASTDYIGTLRFALGERFSDC
jgi:hypothetical protein